MADLKDWWRYPNLPSGEPYDWGGASRGDAVWDNLDFHLDLGCGRVKKGRLGIDRHPDPGVDLVVDLENLHIEAEDNDPEKVAALYEASMVANGRMPFPGNSIESVISHHCLEHIGDGFIRLVDEIHRILIPGGIFRAITPLFPSRIAVEDPDHRRYFMEGTWETFGGTGEGDHWHESFSTPYTRSRFEIMDTDFTPPVPLIEAWSETDARELRVALRKR